LAATDEFFHAQAAANERLLVDETFDEKIDEKFVEERAA
jgi:hypothetical protein